MSETKHTPGPWIAAARPSSVVGLPVVAQTGRSIASVTFFKLGDAFAQHDKESEANARLIAAAPDLLDALIEARDQLQIYAHAEGEDYNSPQISAAIRKATETAQ